MAENLEIVHKMNQCWAWRKRQSYGTILVDLEKGLVRRNALPEAGRS
jgi:hypothetical protein